MKTKAVVSRSDVRLFFTFLIERGALSSYLMWSAEFTPDFYHLFSDENTSFPVEAFISSAFPWWQTPEAARWARLHRCWLLYLKKYRSTKM